MINRRFRDIDNQIGIFEAVINFNYEYNRHDKTVALE